MGSSRNELTQSEAIWNVRYASRGFEGKIRYDPWLSRWKKYFPSQNSNALDIGCGLGLDTEILLECGFKVTAVDLSEEAIALSKKRNPKAIHLNLDISKGIGLAKNSFSVIVANLSLHYFSETETQCIFGVIADLLEEEGFFAFRVNAVGDENYGSLGRKNDWELVDVSGVSKQFFTESMVRDLMKDSFEIISLERMTTNRFGKEKVMLECISKRVFERKSEQPNQVGDSMLHGNK